MHIYIITFIVSYATFLSANLGTTRRRFLWKPYVSNKSLDLDNTL